MNYEYEELRKLGLPEIPDSYRLKFSIKRRATGTDGRTHHKVLSVTVYRKFLGIFFPWKYAFMSRAERSKRYCPDIDFLLENGHLTEEQFLSGKWYPAHLAAAGRYAYNNYILKDIREKQHKKDLKARWKAEKIKEADDLTHIKDFLGKGMP